jgi:hypothetical protein
MPEVVRALRAQEAEWLEALERGDGTEAATALLPELVVEVL